MTLEKRFEAKVDKSGECWLWTARKHPTGYGMFCMNGKMEYAHRAAWKLYKGPIPDGLLVLHTCDNPTCVNPEHLFLGDLSDKYINSARKGRITQREGNGLPGLSFENVKKIRALAGTMSQRAIAQKFGTTGAQVSRIINHKRRKSQ